MVELEEGKHRLREWAGGWSEYEAARSRSRETQYRRFEEADERRREIESLLRERRGQARSHGRGAGRRGTHAQMSKVRQAERALEPVEQVEKPLEPWELHLDLDPGRRVFTGGADPSPARAALRAGRQLPDPGRADEPPRPAGDRGARGRPRRLPGHDRPGHARSPPPRALRGDARNGALTPGYTAPP